MVEKKEFVRYLKHIITCTYIKLKPDYIQEVFGMDCQVLIKVRSIKCYFKIDLSIKRIQNWQACSSEDVSHLSCNLGRRSSFALQYIWPFRDIPG